MTILAVFCDGTWNRDDAIGEETNVTFLRNLIGNQQQNWGVIEVIDEEDEDEGWQVKKIWNNDRKSVLAHIYYDKGVGALGNQARRSLEGSTGVGIDDNIQQAYRFLVERYQLGDKIYLFGFSRAVPLQ